MHYIIDANNLAGKLGILFEDGFDQKLIHLMQDYFRDKKIRVSLVFDSIDTMGDFYHEDGIDIVYTPRDGYYKNADDKIVELVKEQQGVDLQSDFGQQKEVVKGLDEVTVVTDDIEIKNAVQKVAREIARQIYLVQSTDLAEKIREKFGDDGADDLDGETRGLSDDEVGGINDEFLKLWK